MTSKYKKSQNDFNYKTINLLDLSDCKSVQILPYDIKDMLVNVAREFCRLNKNFYYFFDGDKEICLFVALNNKNYVKILIDDSNNWTISHKYTSFKKKKIINASEDLEHLVGSLINDLILN